MVVRWGDCTIILCLELPEQSMQKNCRKERTLKAVDEAFSPWIYGNSVSISHLSPVHVTASSINIIHWLLIPVLQTIMATEPGPHKISYVFVECTLGYVLGNLFLNYYWFSRTKNYPIITRRWSALAQNRKSCLLPRQQYCILGNKMLNSLMTVLSW